MNTPLQSKTPPTTSAVILLIDNDPQSLSSLAAILNISGYECHCAGDAEATVRGLRCLDLDLDLVICNVDFAGDSTPALYQRLLAAASRQGFPLVVISSRPPQALLTPSLHGGTTYWLPKSVSYEDLLTMVHRTLWLPHLLQRHTRSDSHHGVPQPAVGTLTTPATGGRLHALPDFT